MYSLLNFNKSHKHHQMYFWAFSIFPVVSPQVCFHRLFHDHAFLQTLAYSWHSLRTGTIWMALALVESHTTDIKAGDLFTRCVLCIGGWTENIKLLCSDGLEALFSHGVEVTQIFPFGKPVLDKQISLCLNTASPLYNYGALANTRKRGMGKVMWGDLFPDSHSSLSARPGQAGSCQSTDGKPSQEDNTYYLIPPSSHLLSAVLPFPTASLSSSLYGDLLLNGLL